MTNYWTLMTNADTPPPTSPLSCNARQPPSFTSAMIKVQRERDFPSVHEALSGVVGRRRTRPRSFVGLGKDRRRLGRIFWDLPGSFWILSDLFGSCRTNVGLVGLLSDAFQIPILDSDSGFWFWIRTLSSDSSDSDSGFWLWILILRILAASSFRAKRPEVGA